jgi:hypothetical protein
MQNSKFKKIVIAACVFLLQPMMTPTSFALAKKKAPMRAYSFIAEGGKASQGECDGVRKLPRMKRLKEYAKAGGYMGSELQTSDLPGKPGEEMWVHYFKTKPACAVVLAKTPSSIKEETHSKVKAEIPPEDDSEEETDKPSDEANDK